MYKLDPVREARKKYHGMLNKGHKFCLVSKANRDVVMAARDPKILEKFMTFRSDLEMHEIERLLDALPQPH